MPPKNEESSPASADSNPGDTPKKPTRRRAATTTPRLPRAKSTRKSASQAEAAPELSFSSESSSPAPAPAAPPPPAPEPRASAPAKENTPAKESAPAKENAPQRERAADVRESAREESSAPAPQPAPAQETFEPSRGSDGAAPSESPNQQGGGQGQQGGGGQPQGEWQGGGGGGRDRDFWKRNKRKRGRHGGGGGGHWQPGGGGGQPREQHPPQPPPPSNTPVFGELPNPSRFNDLAALEAQAQEISSGGGEPIYLNELYALNLADLTAFARNVGAVFEGAPNRKQLITQVITTAAEKKRPLRDRGYIDVTDRGAFIVHEHVNYRLYPEDPYLPESLITLFGLKRGHRVEVLVQAPLVGERCPSVVRVDTVMGMPAAEISKVTPFEELVPYYPLQRILLESEEPQKDVSMRAVDILTPIGFGQRALIVAPPRTGKTVLLQNIANSITENSPHAKLILLLIDERPEEVTDFKRHTKGEVVSSTFDETPESHVHCAEMVIENARRRVELGEHVVILLDSITRLARAYNALAGNQGKTMSGGLESNALQKPKRFFGSARNIEGGGSLTIVASALIDTGSRMDEIIFEEFKGTGNCELHLDRGLVERRIFPAINIDRSGTRKEELIYHPEELQRIYGLRRAM
ncbi:MAG TPA: transcription termination factor Rho, partial [Opitutus sp.]|nr:transcription termination factor Rho [Opitutus sp.]